MKHHHLDDTEIRRLYDEGLSYKTIGDRLGVDLGTVRNRLLKQPDFEPRRCGAPRIHQIVEDYFENIDTPTKAYLLGLLYADGSNIEGSCVSLDLTDRELVVLFRDTLCPSKSLKILLRKRKTPRHKTIHACRIRSKTLSESLAEKGMVQSKTHKLVYPEWLDSKLNAPFVRGYFDGDGCITWSKAMRSDYRRWTFSLVGTKKFLRAVQTVLKDEVEVKSTVRPMKSVFNLYVRGNKQIARVRDWLYADSGPALQRKQEKFSQVLAVR